MSVTEVHEEGLFSQIKNAIVGVLIGILMFFGAGAMLFYNEYDALYRANDLAEAEKQVISVQADKVDSANQGKLVHMSDTAKTDETLRDTTFGVTREKALKLSRDVEMYQWKEKKHTKTEKKTGGKKVTTTTYTYEKTWSGSVISSSSFKESGHDNPGSMRYSNESWQANKVTLGAFTLTSGQVSSISGWADIAPSEAKSIPRGGMIEGNLIYFRGGRNSATPPPVPGATVEQSSASDMIGDLRVKFKFVGPQAVSIYAGQAGNSFTGFKTSVGHITHMRLDMGTVSAQAMFDSAKSEAAMMKWVLRFVGFLLMLIGVGMVFKPIQVMADIIPFIGNIVGMGLGFLAFAIAAPAALFTIAVAWLMFRPFYGIILMAMGIGIFVGIYKMASGAKGAAAPAAGGGGTPPPPVPSEATPPPVPEA